MLTITRRIFIFPRDIVNLTGYSIRKAQRILQDIRYVLKKKKHQGITVKEFADHQGITPEEIILEW